MGKRRDWRVTHDSWLSSGMTISGFCKSNHISISSFYRGIKQLGLPTARAIKSKAKRSDLPAVTGVKFVQANIIGRDSEATILFPNNIKIKTGVLSPHVLNTLYSLGSGSGV